MGVRIPAPGQPREGLLCSLAQDGGFCERMRPRALRKTCKDSVVEASGGGGTVMLPRFGPRGCQAMRTLGLTRTPDVAYQVSPNLGILSRCGARTMVSPSRLEPASSRLAVSADPKLQILWATLGFTGLFPEHWLNGHFSPAQRVPRPPRPALLHTTGLIS